MIRRSLFLSFIISLILIFCVHLFLVGLKERLQQELKACLPENVNIEVNHVINFLSLRLQLYMKESISISVKLTKGELNGIILMKNWCSLINKTLSWRTFYMKYTKTLVKLQELELGKYSPTL